MNSHRRLPGLSRECKIRHGRGLQHIVEGDPEVVSLVRGRSCQARSRIRWRHQQDVLLGQHHIRCTKCRGRTRCPDHREQSPLLHEPVGTDPPTHRGTPIVLNQDRDVVPQQLPGNPVKRAVEIVNCNPHALGHIFARGILHKQQRAEKDWASQTNGDTGLATFFARVRTRL